jgi:hypothetical protein
MERINIAEKFARFSEQWQPKIVAELNGQEVKLVKVQGTFPWHHHDHVEEMFLGLARAISRRVPGQDCRARARRACHRAPQCRASHCCRRRSRGDPVGASGHLEYWERHRREVHGSHVHEDLRTPILNGSSRSLQPRLQPSSPAAGSPPKSQEGR